MKRSVRLIVGMSLLLSLLMSSTTTQAGNVITRDVPVVSSFKTYMDYRKLNSGSPQGALQKQAVTDANGLRTVNGRYTVAVGSYFSHTIGMPIDVTLDNGTTIQCIIGDAKANQHTTNNHSVGLRGDAVEFIVDTRSLNSTAKTRGDISFIPGFEGVVKCITMYSDIPETDDVIQTPNTETGDIITPEEIEDTTTIVVENKEEVIEDDIEDIVITDDNNTDTVDGSVIETDADADVELETHEISTDEVSITEVLDDIENPYITIE